MSVKFELKHSIFYTQKLILNCRVQMAAILSRTQCIKFEYDNPVTTYWPYIVLLMTKRYSMTTSSNIRYYINVLFMRQWQLIIFPENKMISRSSKHALLLSFHPMMSHPPCPEAKLLYFALLCILWNNWHTNGILLWWTTTAKSARACQEKNSCGWLDIL